MRACCYYYILQLAMRVQNITVCLYHISSAELADHLDTLQCTIHVKIAYRAQYLAFVKHVYHRAYP